MKAKGKNPVFCILLLCGIIFSSFLLAARISQELGGRNVAAAVYYDDICRLAEAGDGDGDEDFWLDLFSELGVSYVIFSDAQDTDFLSVHGLLPACIGNAEGNWAFRIPDGAAPKTDTAIALIENLRRSGTLLPDDFSLEDNDAVYVKALELFPDYADRGGEEICRLIQRACVDRGMHLLLLHPFTENGSIISEPGEYSCLSSLSAELARRGITLGAEFSSTDARPLSPWLLCAAGLMTAALWIWLVCRLGFMKKFETALYILSVPALAAACLLFPRLAQKALMLLCAAIFPTLAAYFIFKARTSAQKRPVAVRYLLLLAFLLLWSLCGGLAVGALMSTREYLLGNDIFSGVKPAQALPLCIAFVLFALPALRDIRKNGLNAKAILPAVGLCVVLVAAAGLLMLRSGDLSGGISSIEKNMRDFLEAVLFARPRTKEFLVAVPFACLMCLDRKKHPLAALPGAMCCTLECVSIVNTFCHAVAPIHVSLIRSVLGAAMGAVLGLVLIGMAAVVKKLRHPGID